MFDNTIDRLLNEVQGVNDEGQEKVAESQEETPETSETTEDDHTKLAEDIQAAGRLMGEAMADAFFAKVAMAVPAAGGGVEPRSTPEQIANKIHQMKGKKNAPGDDTSKRAREEGALHGADGVVNPADYRG